MLNILKINYDNPNKLLSSTVKKLGHITDYLEIILSSLLSMFEYSSNIFNIIDYNNIEYILRVWGTVGFCYDHNSNIIYGFAYAGGKLNKRGIGTKITIQCLDGTCYLKDATECVLGFNNSMRSADRIIYWFAQQFTETDISQVNNVTYSRQAPLFVAKTNSIRVFIENVFKKVRNGEMGIITDGTMVAKGEKAVDTVNLTDVNAIDKLQYLDTYHNALLRRIYTLFGCPLAEGMKLAQQSVDEVNSNTLASKVLPYNNLIMRKKMCEDFTTFFKKDLKVDFSDILRKEIKQDDEV